MPSSEVHFMLGRFSLRSTRLARVTALVRTSNFFLVASVPVLLTVAAAAPAPTEHATTQPAFAATDLPAALPVVRPELETASRYDDEAGGDADADDPAIWAHSKRPWRSVVLGTLKNGGLDAYDIGGELIQHVAAPAAPEEGLESGRFNNVDIATSVPLHGLHDVAVVTDRGRDRLRFYAIDPSGSPAGGEVLTDVTTSTAPRLFNTTEADVENQETGYGLAVRPAKGGGMPWVAVSRRHTTTVGLFRLRAAEGRSLTYRKKSQIALPATFSLADGTTWSPCEEPGEGPQVEGMVVDTRRDVLYAAQEDIGIWRIPFHGKGFGHPRLVDKVREFGVDSTFDPASEECVLDGEVDARRHLSADAEGLTIAYGRHGNDLLFASSQGDSTFALYHLGMKPTFISNVQVGPRPSVPDLDGVDHSDGAAVYPGRLGPGFPRGLVVVHDGENTPVVTDESGELRANTDFKFVRWDRMLEAIGR
jgi:3-phytase